MLSRRDEVSPLRNNQMLKVNLWEWFILYRSDSEFIVLLRVNALVLPVPELDILRIFLVSLSSNSPLSDAAVAY
jgi:hypothetical protein